MNIYTKLIASTIFLASLTGCNLPHRELGENLTEPAKVVDLPFVPAGHGDGTGISMNGKLTFTSMDIPARYAVVFECQHGRFVIENKPDLWKRLRVGQDVTVTYSVVYLVDDEKHTKDAISLHFIDAK